ncbi:MAG: SRPBCC domain-containing protein [Micromonosporaceae bacterium]
MALPDSIERVLDLAHPPRKVWAALTTAEGLGGWFGDSAVIDLRPDGEATLHWNGDGDHTLSIKVVEPPRRFGFTWGIDGLPASDPRRTYVEFRLEPTTGGTRLTVVESGFAQLPDELERAYKGNVEGWESELAELVGYLDGQVDGPGGA